MTADGRHADKTPRVAHDGTEYHCQAYGPGSDGLCFMEEIYPCTARAMCEAVMKQERMRLYVRLLALAASGDETANAILIMTDRPEELLNGDYWQARRDELE